MSSRHKVAREETERLHRRLAQIVQDRDVVRKSELQQTVADARERLRAVLDDGTRAFRIFDRMSGEIGSFWVNENRSPYLERTDCEYAQKWVDLTAAVLRELDPSATAADALQYTLKAGDGYGNIRTILRVMKSATKQLTIVDPYLDSSVFNYLDEIDDSVVLRLLTGKARPMFTTLLAELRKQRPEVHARSSSKFHDRIVVLDDTEVWQLGCSLNGVGRATSMLNRVSDAEAKAKLFDEFASAWSAGVVL